MERLPGKAGLANQAHAAARQRFLCHRAAIAKHLRLRPAVAPQAGIGRDRVDAVPLGKLLVVEGKISLVGQSLDMEPGDEKMVASGHRTTSSGLLISINGSRWQSFDK
jgi:hypothetical protein